MKKNSIANPEELFDKTKFATLIIGKENEDKSNNDSTSDLIDLIVSKDNADIKQETYKLLKEANALEFIMASINKTNDAQIKQRLTAACWEADIDCSKHLSYFVDLAIQNDFSVAMEAITVVEQMQPPFDKEELEKNISGLAVAIQSHSKEDKAILLDQLQQVLHTFMTY